MEAWTVAIGKQVHILAAGALAALLTSPAAMAQTTPPAPNVEAGFRAWQAGNYDEAVRNWRALAEAGDADAQFNLGHAYRLGRGVPQDMSQAEQYYARAARAGHLEAQAMYGVMLFQDGRRTEAMPFIQRGAEAGDPRAQYVYGTALFNGDLAPRDWPRAWAMMSRASAQGLAPATTRLAEMQQHLSTDDRTRGDQLAAEMARATTTAQPAPTQVAAAQPPRTAAPTPAPPAPRPAAPVPAPAAARLAPRPTAPTSLAASGGRWRVQLGAFSSEANARGAWSAISGRLPGLQPYYVRAGNVFRLQAGPLASRDAAARACAAARQACFPVAP